jgi:hypothetical protein
MLDDSSWTILWNDNQAQDRAHPHLASRIGNDRCSGGFTPTPLRILTVLKSDTELVQLQLFPYDVRFLSPTRLLSGHCSLVLPLSTTLDYTVKR